jgi:hypothetical protein
MNSQEKEAKSLNVEEELPHVLFLKYKRWQVVVQNSI